MDNATIWENLYARGEGLYACPSEMVVRLSARVFGDKARILDYSFGAGANLIHLLQRGYDVCGVEVSESALAVTRARLESQHLRADLRLADPESIPFEDASFDAVLAWHVLYYNDWRSLARAVAEINRVLRPGGAFLGTMAAPGDASHTDAVPLGDGVFQSRAAGQAGATVLVLEEKDLARCFPGQSLTIGHLSWEFDRAHNRSWIVSYRKALIPISQNL